MPVTAIIFPARTAREIPTFGSNGDPVEKCWRLLLKVLAPFKRYLPYPEPSCQMGAFLHRGLSLTLCKNPETESVRDQQQGHDESRDEISGTQLARHETGVIGLVESIEQIGCTRD